MPSVSIGRLGPRRPVLALAVAMGMVVAAVASAAAQGPVHAVVAGAGPTRNVIVVLRNQHTYLTITKGRAASARVNAFRSDQAPLLSRARTDGVRNLHGYTV